MDKNELVFSSDCAINFDDLGEFRDFTQDIQKMLHNLSQIKTNKSAVLNQQLFRQILKADPEDTFHAPAFQDLINVVLQIMNEQNDYFKSKRQIYKLIFYNLMEILEESFVSYQFSEETGPKICEFMIEKGKRKQFSEFQKMSLLLCLSKLTKRLSYIDDLQNYSNLLYHCIDEQSIIMEKTANAQWKKMMLQVYTEVIQLATRNRKVRELLGKKMDSQNVQTIDHFFMGYKIYLWRKDQKVQLYLAKMEIELLTNYQVFNFASNNPV